MESLHKICITSLRLIIEGVFFYIVLVFVCLFLDQLQYLHNQTSTPNTYTFNFKNQLKLAVIITIITVHIPWSIGCSVRGAVVGVAVVVVSETKLEWKMFRP